MKFTARGKGDDEAVVRKWTLKCLQRTVVTKCKLKCGARSGATKRTFKCVQLKVSSKTVGLYQAFLYY